jgi:hypothetical protein
MLISGSRSPRPANTATLFELFTKTAHFKPARATAGWLAWAGSAPAALSR